MERGVDFNRIIFSWLATGFSDSAISGWSTFREEVFSDPIQVATQRTAPRSPPSGWPSAQNHGGIAEEPQGAGQPVSSKSCSFFVASASFSFEATNRSTRA